MNTSKTRPLSTAKVENIAPIMMEMYGNGCFQFAVDVGATLVRKVAHVLQQVSWCWVSAKYTVDMLSAHMEERNTYESAREATMLRFDMQVIQLALH